MVAVPRRLLLIPPPRTVTRELGLDQGAVTPPGPLHEAAANTALVPEAIQGRPRHTRVIAVSAVTQVSHREVADLRTPPRPLHTGLHGEGAVAHTGVIPLASPIGAADDPPLALMVKEIPATLDPDPPGPRDLLAGPLATGDRADTSPETPVRLIALQDVLTLGGGLRTRIRADDAPRLPDSPTPLVATPRAATPLPCLEVIRHEVVRATGNESPSRRPPASAPRMPRPALRQLTGRVPTPPLGWEMGVPVVRTGAYEAVAGQRGFYALWDPTPPDARLPPRRPRLGPPGKPFLETALPGRLRATVIMLESAPEEPSEAAGAPMLAGGTYATSPPLAEPVTRG